MNIWVFANVKKHSKLIFIKKLVFIKKTPTLQEGTLTHFSCYLYCKTYGIWVYKHKHMFLFGLQERVNNDFDLLHFDRKMQLDANPAGPSNGHILVFNRLIYNLCN